MFPTFATRSVEPELIDGTDYTAEELLASLADLRRINRFLGGRRTLLKHLLPMIEVLGRRKCVCSTLGLALLTFPSRVAKWARRQVVRSSLSWWTTIGSPRNRLIASHQNTKR
jgi:hypothetical protein